MIMRVVTRKRYSKEFKAQAVELVRNGQPVAELAEELEITSGMLYKWVRQAPQLGSEGARAEGEESEADELRRLRRLSAKLQLENDILKKAAVILGTKPPKNDAS